MSKQNIRIGLLKQNFVDQLILDKVRMRSFCVFLKKHNKYFHVAGIHDIRLCREESCEF